MRIHTTTETTQCASAFRKRVIDLDATVPNGALELGVSEKQLDLHDDRAARYVASVTQIFDP